MVASSRVKGQQGVTWVRTRLEKLGYWCQVSQDKIVWIFDAATGRRMPICVSNDFFSKEIRTEMGLSGMKVPSKSGFDIIAIHRTTGETRYIQVKRDAGEARMQSYASVESALSFFPIDSELHILVQNKPMGRINWEIRKIKSRVKSGETNG